MPCTQKQGRFGCTCQVWKTCQRFLCSSRLTADLILIFRSVVLCQCPNVAVRVYMRKELWILSAASRHCCRSATKCVHALKAPASICCEKRSRTFSMVDLSRVHNPLSLCHKQKHTHTHGSSSSCMSCLSMFQLYPGSSQPTPHSTLFILEAKPALLADSTSSSA